MEILILVVTMAIMGLLMGYVAGFIWKEERPLGVPGDYYVAVATTIAVGLIDWFVIPAMGFSTTLKYLGVALEPAIGALLVLWIIKRARSG